MSKMTISIPDEELSEFRKSHPEINVAEVVRRGIIKKLEKLEKLNSKGMI